MLCIYHSHWETKDSIQLFAIGLTFIVSAIGLYVSWKNSHKANFINSVTASRIKWIDNLRNNIAQFSGFVYHFSLTDIPDKEEKNKIIKEIDRLRYLIKLQLNNSADIDKEIISLVDKIVDLTDPKKSDELTQTLNTLVLKTQTLLKFEWERVKEESIKGDLSIENRNKLFKEFLERNKISIEMSIAHQLKISKAVIFDL